MCSKYSHKFCKLAHFMKIKCARTNQIGNISAQLFMLSNSSLHPALSLSSAVSTQQFLIRFWNPAWHNLLAFSRPFFHVSLLFLSNLLYTSTSTPSTFSPYTSSPFTCSSTVYSSFISVNSICYLKPQSKFLLCFRLNFNSQLRA